MDQLFHKKLKQAIIQTESSPAGNILYVYLGSATTAELHRVRQQIPPHRPLLYIYNDQTGIPKEFIAFAHTTSMTLPLAAGNPEADNNLALAVNCLSIEKVNLGKSPLPGIFPENYALQISSRVQALISGLNQERISGLLNLRGSIRNLPQMIKHHGMTVKASAGPCLICGSGPSLETQLEWLKAHRLEYYLIAVGKLAPRLCRAGINPDCVVYVDNSGYGLDWHEVFAAPDTLLVTFPSAAPELCSLAKQIFFGRGPTPYFNRALTEWKLTLPLLAYGGTATLTAIDFARKAGFTAIALLGNDLCLGPNGMSHVSDYSDEQQFEHRPQTIPGNAGPVTTTPEFLRLKEYLENYLAKPCKTNICNCTAGGAIIRGCHYQRLEEFMLEQCNGKPSLAISYQHENPSIHWSLQLEKAAQEIARLYFSNVSPSRQALADYEKYRSQTISFWAKTFTEELRQNFTIVQTKLNQPMEPPISGFRQLGLEIIRRNNPELADYLLLHRLKAPDFQIEYNFSEYAYIARIIAGTMIPLSDDYLHLKEKAEVTMDAFLNEQHFDPERHALVFIAPGAWMHVTAFGRKYPDAYAICLEPWPELLSELLDNCMFMHQLPAATIIIAASAELKEWRRQYQNAIRKVIRQGKKVLFFINPLAENQPEVVELRRWIIS